MEAQSRLLEMAALLPHVLIIASFILNAAGAAAASTAILLEPGFSASPHTSFGEFQPLLADPTGVFAFGFLQPNNTELDLAVVHVPSLFPVWRAIPARPTTWSESASLSFNDKLVFYDSHGSVLWSTAAAAGDNVVLLNTSNLQILKSSDVVWQSFDFPEDTLMQNQNFTSRSLVLSTNQRYSLRLGSSFYGLYMELGGGSTALPPLYYKHWALKYRSVGEPPLSLMVMPDGFLGLFQGAENRVDLIPFDSFGRNLDAIHRLTLEADGNLRAYYWNDTHGWATEYTTVTDDCGVPTACGVYGLCTEGVSAASRCHCLENSTNACPAAGAGDFCGSNGGDYISYSEFRREGVDFANKEWMRFEVLRSADECEAGCKQNCTCWGAVYNNVSGYCYQIDYPVQTLVVADERKVGYFKVKNSSSGGGGGGRKKAKVALLVIGSTILLGAAAYGAYRVWNWKKMGSGEGAGPYRELVKSVSSLELSNPFRRK